MIDEIYVIARRVLLDALDALAPHRAALTLVGAQAVYLRAGEIEGIPVSPFTSDADLSIHPELLAERPPIHEKMRAAGFIQEPGAVGIWIAKRRMESGVEARVPVDFLVPERLVTTSGRRSAPLKGHDARTARRVNGLEGALVDADQLEIAALESSDSRRILLRVAGPAALLVAKLHKITERAGSKRAVEKDALDVLRLLRGTSTEELLERWRSLLGDARSREPARAARSMLLELFGAPRALRSTAAASAAIGASGDEITTSCALLANDVLAGLG
jgi:hypothetical protein